MSSILNQEVFVENIKDQLNKAMLEAAEPVIQRALKDAEREMRKQLASNLISFMDKTVQFDSFGADLRILIKRD